MIELISPPVTLKAIGMAIGVMIAYTPQEVPVKKEMNAQTRNVSARRRAGVIQLSVTLITKFAVPSSVLMALMQYARATQC